MLTVVVTGVGAIIGQGVVRSLRASGLPLRVVGVDRNPDSVGRSLCDAFHAKPRCDESDPAYRRFWRELASAEQVGLVLPALELDVLYLDSQRELFAGLGVPLALNRSELIALSADKWHCGQAVASLGLPAIPTRQDGDWEMLLSALGPAPLLMKPRDGNGSRGVVRLHDAADHAYWRGRHGGNNLVQRIVGSDDEEYTVGVFGFGDGEALPPIVMRRRLAQAGNTAFAETAHEPAVVAATGTLVRHLRPLGPTNFQFRVEAGQAYLLEINPRFSSSASLRTAFGYNEAVMAVDFYAHARRPATPVLRAGRAWRYAEDFVEYAGDSF
ncbi:ATP-grasp domain-containing protein [Cupriavidus malaysiensis]|uniref:ATP-grasp domain-containing protein n=1 Tax=Cupriavidus malaysiensis TaxID=367825 RepID=A0ABM6FEI6_9BURK|nr:ATP-grasp domain-containing protein [Cupriavidus malaysiensis]AOZ10215.1 hypothetical protein BKK80_31855 [Cupriavidus malaysiensis]